MLSKAHTVGIQLGQGRMNPRSQIQQFGFLRIRLESSSVRRYCRTDPNPLDERIDHRGEALADLRQLLSDQTVARQDVSQLDIYSGPITGAPVRDLGGRKRVRWVRVESNLRRS